MTSNENKLKDIKLRKIHHILNNQFVEMYNSGFQALRRDLDRYLIKQELKTNKSFQRDFILAFVQKINQILKPTNIIIKKRFFKLMRDIRKNEISVRIGKYEALKTLIFNNKLLLRRGFSAFQEKRIFFIFY